MLAELTDFQTKHAPRPIPSLVSFEVIPPLWEKPSPLGNLYMYVSRLFCKDSSLLPYSIFCLKTNSTLEPAFLLNIFFFFCVTLAYCKDIQQSILRLWWLTACILSAIELPQQHKWKPRYAQ